MNNGIRLGHGFGSALVENDQIVVFCLTLPFVVDTFERRGGDLFHFRQSLGTLGREGSFQGRIARGYQEDSRIAAILEDRIRRVVQLQSIGLNSSPDR